MPLGLDIYGTDPAHLTTVCQLSRKQPRRRSFSHVYDHRLSCFSERPRCCNQQVRRCLLGFLSLSSAWKAKAVRKFRIPTAFTGFPQTLQSSPAMRSPLRHPRPSTNIMKLDEHGHMTSTTPCSALENAGIAGGSTSGPARCLDLSLIHI